ncbi:sugar phosphate isomerase/epimerase [Spirosoma sp. KCTC 42546]|uniref:sugar phosphate isomerase/epimerase family protein n=1 Tax=Spirosoma sp. KCTC 42546 TaxID=2520506 RepID=UPI001157D8D9|nr:sugar phosphate isomerase/epimerase [Spirosoma sp. KCTC 42546]QDK79825.1 sugar phosphate isomerase/epimerase [Spirosoma sp. KCTC 42546]
MNYSEKITRQQFLKLGALATSAALLPQLDAFAASPKKVGLQLYTLRDLMAKDPDSTLKKVAEIGYKEVELFGYSDGKFFGKTPKEFAAQLKSLGLSVPSGHYTTGKTMPNAKGTLTNDWKRAVDDAATLGQKYMVCAYLFPDERKKLDDYKQFADLFNKSAEVVKAAGMQFCYHNHDFEFKEIDGKLPYDVLLSGTDKNLVKLELDLYWATFANQDPVALFKKHPGRFPLWHIKDMEKTAERAFAPVGTGSINFQRIFDAKKTAGMTHYFVEQDVCKLPPLESIAISYKNVEKLKV